MILKRLVEFWESQADARPSGFSEEFVTHRVMLDADGSLVNVVPLSKSKKGQRQGEWKDVPKEQPGRSGTKPPPRLIHDLARYVIGLAKEGESEASVATRHEPYIALLTKCFNETGHPAIGAVLRWASEANPQALANEYRLTAEDYLHIMVGGEDPALHPSVVGFWQQKEEGTSARCLVTGGEGPIVDRMPYPIKGIPGGHSAGTMLVTVNMKAGESYGLEANHNSPIGTASAEAICNGLNRLLNDPNHSYRVGEGVYVYWARGKEERDALKALKEPTKEEVEPLRAQYRKRRRSNEAKTERVGAQLATLHKGGKAPKADAADFYVLSLTAYGPRIVVRDYHELTWPVAQANMGEWFERLALVGPYGEELRPMSVRNLADSLYRDSKDVPKHVPVALIQCALTGSPLPRNLLAIAVRRNVVEQGPVITNPKTPWLRDARISLIKAVLTDQFPDYDLSQMITETPQPQAYVCGRLLAVLETIQYYALRDPRTKRARTNATLVDKFYGSFSTAPNVSIGPLMSMATKAHLPKIRRASPATCAALTERLEQVSMLIDKPLPSTFDYTDQGLFALGFYHQKAHDRAESRMAKERGEDTPLGDLAEGHDITTTEEGDNE